MFHARSMSRSPADRYLPSTVPRLSGVTFSRTKFTPFLTHGARAASSGSKSMIVIFFGETLMWSRRIGRVQRATKPKPTKRMRLLNVTIVGRGPPILREKNQSRKYTADSAKRVGSSSPIHAGRSAPGKRECWRRFGAAHAPSPDARYGHPALRSLGCKLRSAILAALVCIRRLWGMGSPSRVKRTDYTDVKGGESGYVCEQLCSG